MIYTPAEDSYLLARFIPLYAKSKSFLDMGAGSGIQAETALKAGASSVLVVDIDPKVIAHLIKKHMPAMH